MSIFQKSIFAIVQPSDYPVTYILTIQGNTIFIQINLDIEKC